MVSQYQSRNLVAPDREKLAILVMHRSVHEGHLLTLDEVHRISDLLMELRGFIDMAGNGADAPSERDQGLLRVERASSRTERKRNDGSPGTDHLLQIVGGFLASRFHAGLGAQGQSFRLFLSGARRTGISGGDSSRCRCGRGRGSLTIKGWHARNRRSPPGSSPETQARPGFGHGWTAGEGSTPRSTVRCDQTAGQARPSQSGPRRASRGPS